MPIFEYLCNKCCKEFSTIKFRADESPTECPSCGTTDVTKKISAFSCSTSSGFMERGPATGGG